MALKFKLKGRIPDDDTRHQIMASLTPPLLAAKSVHVPGVGYVPQYADTVFGTSVRYDPANDCKGYFTSSKFQAHNNCYNYAVDIATNTIAQPGRRHGILLSASLGPDNADVVVKGAEADCLIHAGTPG